MWQRLKLNAQLEIGGYKEGPATKFDTLIGNLTPCGGRVICL